MLTNTKLIAIVQIRMSFWKVRETLARTLFWFLIQLILQKGAHIGVPAIAASRYFTGQTKMTQGANPHQELLKQSKS